MLTTDQRSAATRLGYEAAGWNSEPELEVSKENKGVPTDSRQLDASGPLGGLDSLEGADAGRRSPSPDESRRPTCPVEDLGEFLRKYEAPSEVLGRLHARGVRTVPQAVAASFSQDDLKALGLTSMKARKFVYGALRELRGTRAAVEFAPKLAPARPRPEPVQLTRPLMRPGSSLAPPSPGHGPGGGPPSAAPPSPGRMNAASPRANPQSSPGERSDPSFGEWAFERTGGPRRLADVAKAGVSL